MPELPEVETVARSLRPHLIGDAVLDVWSSGLALRQPIDLAALRAQCGSVVTAIDRLGKYLLFRFSNGRTLVSHLGMTGRYLLTPHGAAAAPHTHLSWSLRSGRDLRYIDPRRFGMAVLRGPGPAPEIAELGPDPLGPAFTVGHLAGALRASRRDLKALLLDQAVVAGLGNIYVAEALFLAGLSPMRRGQQVSRPAAGRLHAAIGTVIEGAVARRGTTLSDGGYADADERAGQNQHHLMVYGREGEPCRACGTAIRRVVQAQRSSFYCPKCQR